MKLHPNSTNSILLKRISVIGLFLGLLIICLILPSSPLHAAADTTTDVTRIDDVIQQKLADYNGIFPEIQFVRLKNEAWHESLQALELLLGYQATSLDYQHPEDVREELLFATVEKIKLMLVHNITASFLFRVGQRPFANRQHVCVIITDPGSTLISNRTATEYFIDLPLDGVAARRFVDKDEHLQYIVDHEAYHCLDSYYYGGIPMSYKQFSTRHEIYRRETEADMFALAMHIQRNKGLTDYAAKIMHLRGMSLLNGELQHYSAPGMQQVIEYDNQAITGQSVAQLLRLVKQLYRPLALSYDQYLQYRTNAVAAIHQLGRSVNEYDEPVLPENLQPYQQQVEHLLRQTLEHYQAFFGQLYPGLD